MWSKEPPTEPGYYWFMSITGFGPYVVHFKNKRWYLGTSAWEALYGEWYSERIQEPSNDY